MTKATSSMFHSIDQRSERFSPPTAMAELGRRKRILIGNCLRLTRTCLVSLLLLSLSKECLGAKPVVTSNPKETKSATSSSSSSSSSTSTNPLPRRERNVDYWDVDTLAFYLGIDPITGKRSSNQATTTAYPGYDVAVMFYASWCRNCHALAPYWDRIATVLKAGTASSKLIMAFFDCERNAQHEKICTAASVTHYPTLMFVGAGPYHDTDAVSRLLVGKKRAAGPAGPTNIPNAVKFQGNWKYADSILDWINTMQMLSRWHIALTQGWLRVLRNGVLGAIFPPLRPKSSSTQLAVGGTSLPVGLPSSGTGQSVAKVSALQKQVEDLQAKSKKYSNLVVRSSTLLDALLFPVGQPSQVMVLPNSTTANINGTTTTNTTTTTASSKKTYAFDQYTDVFTLLQERNAWNLTLKGSSPSSNPTTFVILSCVLDVALDACQRVNTHVTTDVADHYPYEDIFRNYTKLNNMLDSLVEDREPYCGIVEQCWIKDFAPAVCRPTTCPFRDPVICRYLTACLTEPIQTEYAVALELIKEGEKFPPPPPPKQKTTTTSSSTTTDKTKDNKKKSVWGMF